MTPRFWLFLCMALLSLPKLTDWAVDHQFRQQHTEQSYSKAQTDAVADLIARSHGRTVYVWRDAKAAAIADALSLTPDSVDTRLP